MGKLGALILVLIMMAKGYFPSEHTNISKYETDLESVGGIEYMPERDSLTDYTDIRYSYKEIDTIMFVSYGLALFVEYDAEVYESKKEEACETHEFLKEPVKAWGATEDGRAHMSLPVTEYTYRGYNMKLIDGGSCKSFSMIGFNDELYTVVYCYFCDSDLDLISTEGDDPEKAMVDFTDEHFKWR